MRMEVTPDKNLNGAWIELHPDNDYQPVQKFYQTKGQLLKLLADLYYLVSEPRLVDRSELYLDRG